MVRRSTRSCFAVLLAIGLAALPREGRAAGPAADYEALAVEGDELLEHGEPAEAARRFDAAYRAMPPQVRVGDFGRFVVVRADESYAQAQAQGDDPALLRANRDLLRLMFAEQAAAGDGTPPSDVAHLQPRLRQLEQTLEEQEATEAEPGASGRAGRTDAPPRGELDTLGLGLAIGGGIALVGGTALAIRGARFPRLLDQARQDSLAAYDLMEGEEPPDWDAFERRKQAQGRALLASGITLAIVGTAAIVYGSLRIHRQRAASSRVAFAPLPRGGAVVLHARF